MVPPPSPPGQVNLLDDVAMTEVRELRQLVEVLKAQLADRQGRGAEVEEVQVGHGIRVL